MPRAPAGGARRFRYEAPTAHAPVERYAAALRVLAADHFRRPRAFGGVTTALFGPRLRPVDRLLGEGRCAVEALPERDPFHQAAHWHNRLCNPRIPDPGSGLRAGLAARGGPRGRAAVGERARPPRPFRPIAQNFL